VREINAPTSDAEWGLTASILRGIAFVGSAVAVALLVVYPLYVGALAQAGAAGQESLAILVGPMLWVRLLLLAVTAVILSFFVYRMAGTATVKRARTLVVLVLVTFVLAFASEFLGRMLHYAIMVRVGI
jgi:anaerobic dimethyl sulfoxide reductase subunit C (anchor subunit)